LTTAESRFRSNSLSQIAAHYAAGWEATWALPTVTQECEAPAGQCQVLSFVDRATTLSNSAQAIDQKARQILKGISRHLKSSGARRALRRLLKKLDAMQSTLTAQIAQAPQQTTLCE
jgi:hypothetical protein